MGIKKITPSVCKDLSAAMDKALESVGKQYGVVIKCGNAGYENTKCHFKVNVVLEGVDVEKEEWNNYCHFFDFTADDFGKQFRANGVTYKISGLKPKGRKNTILAKKEGDSRNWMFNHEDVKRAMIK